MRLLKLLSLTVWLVTSALAEDGTSINREFQLKTAYLFHFAELTQWPDSAPIRICLLGNSALRAYLPVLEGQQINDTLVSIELGDKPDLSRCRILFLTELATLAPALIEQARLSHILLVSDVQNFAAHGGMVEFSLRDNKLNLVINLSAVKSASLKLSSKLLRMAEILE